MSPQHEELYLGATALERLKITAIEQRNELHAQLSENYAGSQVLGMRAHDSDGSWPTWSKQKNIKLDNRGLVDTDVLIFPAHLKPQVVVLICCCGKFSECLKGKWPSCRKEPGSSLRKV